MVVVVWPEVVGIGLWVYSDWFLKVKIELGVWLFGNAIKAFGFVWNEKCEVFDIEMKSGSLDLVICHFGLMSEMGLGFKLEIDIFQLRRSHDHVGNRIWHLKHARNRSGMECVVRNILNGSWVLSNGLMGEEDD
jgi:hypothetical protein